MPQELGYTLDVTWTGTNTDLVYLGMSAGVPAEIGRNATTPVHPTSAQVIVVPIPDVYKRFGIFIETVKVNASGVDEAKPGFTPDGTTKMRAWQASSPEQIASTNIGSADGVPGPYLTRGASGAYHEVTLEDVQFTLASTVGQKRGVYVGFQLASGQSDIGAVGAFGYTILLKPAAAGTAGKVATVRFNIYHCFGR